MKYLIAIAAAAAVYHFLGTEKGKQLVKQVADTGCELKDSLMEKGREAIDSLKGKAGMA